MRNATQDTYTRGIVRHGVTQICALSTEDAHVPLLDMNLTGIFCFEYERTVFNMWRDKPLKMTEILPQKEAERLSSNAG
ncbi:MAG: hypothetical protein Pg6C_13410 [Treponemataceae bacterium]|nr:MAG: hypothetical protein Pg6C_13410 [Treponemataceae bacterium]